MRDGVPMATAAPAGWGMPVTGSMRNVVNVPERWFIA